MFRKVSNLLSQLALLGLMLITIPGARAGSLQQTSAQSFGVFNDVEYIQYTGRFTGFTSLGEFDVPFEIVAPLSTQFANGTVLIEPPHFLLSTGTRDIALSDLLFGWGFSFASVGFGEFGLNILDPTQPGLLVGGLPYAGTSDETEAITDLDIIVQFADALVADPVANEILGPVYNRYAAGGSQTARVLLQILHRPAGQGLFDLTLLSVARWKSPDIPPELVEELPDDFSPISGIGKVIFVQSEGDVVFGNAMQFRSAVEGPLADPANYRLYEVSGTPHAPFVNQPGLNRLSWVSTVRAAFVAGDAWVASAAAPPPSLLMADVPSGTIDPVYGFETGIARDLDRNALGGVRLPEFEAGRGLYIASLVNQGIPLVGAFVDLTCAPRPGSGSDEPRFRSHGDYVRQITNQASLLREHGYLLDGDAEALVDEAAGSAIGKPGTCPDGS